MVFVASESEEDEEPYQKPLVRDESKFFRETNHVDPNNVISDDDDFEADLKAAQQQAKEKERQNKLAENHFGDKKEREEVFDEQIKNRNVALAHQQYNTDKAIGGIVSDSKPKKKKKKSKNNLNKAALAAQVQNQFGAPNNFADPGGQYQKGKIAAH